MSPIETNRPAIVLLASLLLTSTSSLADTGFYETEPNDKPADFHRIQGEVSLYGTMVGADQDGYLWTVTDNDARKRWTFHLNGEPGALTIVDVARLEYAANGIDVASRQKLFKMGTRDGVTPSVHEDLAFEPGEYVIGLAQAGAGRGEQTGSFRPPMTSLSFGEAESEDGEGSTSDSSAELVESPSVPPNAEPGAYRLIISEAKKLNPQPNPKGRDSRDTAHPLRPRREFATFESAETTWYSLTFSETDAVARWDVRVQAPIGRELQARLVDANGEERLRGSVNDKGKLRFPDLAPTPDTTWFIELTAKHPGFIHAISSSAVGQRVAGEEIEPNTNYNFANRVDFVQPVTGRLGGDDPADHFVFTADAATGEERRTLRIETDPPARIQLCLKNPQWGPVQCRDGNAPLELPDLSLGAGDWGITVDRASPETAYTLSLVSQGPVQAGKEVEPNDRIEYARGVPDKLRIKGRFSGADTDFYEILVSDAAQLWRFQVIGDEVFELGYYDGSRQQKDKIRAAAGQRRVRLDNVFLLPGRHYIRVSGRDGGNYTLLARALGPPDPNGEMEPNDQHNKQRLAIGQTRTGVSADKNDRDYYRFFVGNWDHLRLTLTPPADGVIAPNLYWYGNVIGQGQPGAPGAPLVMQGLFPPGDYHLVLNPRQASDAEYTLSLERLPRWSCPADCEPNGQGLIWLAAPLPADLVLQGNSWDWRDFDYYELPVFEQATELHIRSPEPVRLELGTRARDKQGLKHDPEFGGYQTMVPAGERYRLMVESRGKPYRLELEFPNGEVTPVTEPLPASLALSLDHTAVSAFRVHGQRVAAALTVRNPGSAVLDATVETATSDHRWSVRLGAAQITIPAAGEVTIPVEILVPDDAWADHPVRISARAVDASGRQAETWAEIAVERERPPVNPVLFWSMPQALRGGINSAWLPFGAAWTDDSPKWATDRDYLRDGFVFDGMRLTSGADGDGWQAGEHPELTLDLPGDDPVPVAGTAVNHFGTPGPFFDIREGTLLLSLDGVNFTEALRFEALPVETEQQFALKTPMAARFARLRIDSTFRERSAERASMAQWKVILEPGYDLSGGEGYNIADPSRGGHLVSDWPPEFYSPRRVLTPDDASKTALMNRGDTKQYIVAFHQNRAAQITGIDWNYADDAREELKIFERIEVARSLESPIGPWQPLGELAIDPQTFNGSLQLAKPTWARFVRFTAHKDPAKRPAQAPGQILIHERPNGAGYLSVLGEWGTKSQRAFYELQQGLPVEGALAAVNNTSRARAAALRPATPVQGYVSLGRQEHWFKLSVPPGQNTLTIAVHGDPTVRTVVKLENAAGEKIPLRRIDQKLTPSLHEFEAVVEPSSDVYFHISEPPRNVAFSWDTSASVLAHIPMINNAIVAFSGQVVPGKEAVNLFPFPTGPLLKNWLGEPYMLQTILNDYRRPSSSSAAEVTLKRTAHALGPRAGTKAIVVITDGDVNHDGHMWGEYQTTQPRVFSLQVAGAEPLHQQLLRDWAMVNGGHFTQLLYDGEMEVAFDRATTLMHRPAGYTLQVDSEYREAPGPGLLSVVAGDTDSRGGAAVELILDASGSMLQRMDGKRRINIAKEVLTEAVQKHIPVGTPVALRVFGHKEVDSCRTDIEIPLGPLNPSAATAKIAGINAMNLARTPIADSLKAVASDLKAAGGGVVVLVTDGEETCEGDPAAAIEALQSSGFEVNLNIVGFAIDDADLAALFQSWAEAGGGRYFGADDQSGLSTAIEDALKVPFTVYDQGGNEVATGQVGGEPVEVEQGYYRVVVKSSLQKTFDKVEVQGEEGVVLKIE